MPVIKSLEEKKKIFVDMKLQIYALLSQGKTNEAQTAYNNYFLLYKDLVREGTPGDNVRWHADITRLYNKLQQTLTSQGKGSPYTAVAAQQSKSAEAIRQNFIETEFDILLKLIEEKGRLKLNEIEQRFSISKKLAEEWIQILADHDLVEIHYLPVGGVEVSRASPELKKTK